MSSRPRSRAWRLNVEVEREHQVWPFDGSTGAMAKLLPAAGHLAVGYFDGA
jgi:hypothetical protein